MREKREREQHDEEKSSLSIRDLMAEIALITVLAPALGEESAWNTRSTATSSPTSPRAAAPTTSWTMPTVWSIPARAIGLAINKGRRRRSLALNLAVAHARVGPSWGIRMRWGCLPGCSGTDTVCTIHVLLTNNPRCSKYLHQLLKLCRWDLCGDAGICD